MSMDYSALSNQLEALMDGVFCEVSNLSNASALLWQTLSDLNWVGFYKLIDGTLILGPFQGKPACIRIPTGKGVCGTAVAENRVQRVENVHTYPGHIACDSASNSEIVLPLYRREEIWGVLDIDSPSFCRFTEEDQRGLEQISDVLSKMLSGDLTISW